MSIVLFEDITTESALLEIEENGKKYEGLYVEMDNPPERKYVKGMASQINDILKKLDRARIDKSKEYKQKVEQEASQIRHRLQQANKPFTLLIDEYNAKRAEILKKEKEARERIELFQQIEKDHEFAILLNSQFDSEKVEREKAKAEHEANLKKEAEELARIKFEQDAIKAKECERLAKEKREADKANVAHINNLALNDFVSAGLDQESAKKAVIAIAKNQVSNVSIQY